MQNASMTFTLTGPDPLIFGLWKNLDAKGFRITNLVEGVGASDAVTKGQLNTVRDAFAGYASDIVSQGNVPIYGTVLGMPSLTVPAGIQYIRVSGYYAIGDAGAWRWKRVASQPAHTARFRTTDRFMPDGSADAANGGWWEPVADPVISIEACGAKGDWNAATKSGTDNAPMVQAAFDVAKKAMNAKGLSGGTIVVGQGRFGMGATVTWHEACKMIGRGRDLSAFYRAADYGDTFVAGAALAGPTAYARQIEIHDVTLSHGDGYNRTTNAAMGNKVAAGAHLRVYGGLKAVVSRCAFSRMREGVTFHGGANIEVDGNIFYGVWDPDNVDNQEGFHQLGILFDPVHGLPTNWDVSRNYFAGQASNLRDLTWTTDNGVQTRTYSRSIGSRYGIRMTGMENGKFHNNHFGGLERAEFLVSIVSGGGLLDVDVGPGNFFDGCSHGRGFLLEGSDLAGLDLKIHGNTFIDQMGGISITRLTGGALPSIYGLQIHDNVMRNMIGGGIYIGAAKGFTIHDNTIGSYNRFNLAANEMTYASGIAIADVAADGDIYSNKIGGGVTGGAARPSITTVYPEVTPPYNSDPNFCWYDVFVDAGLVDISHYDNRSAKTTTRRTPVVPSGLR